MKNVVFALIIFILAIYLFFLMSRPKGYRHAIFRGAPTKVVLKVVDDTGNVVSGAHIEAIFNNYIREPKIRKGLTDKNGEFVAQHKSTGEIDYFITKKGYYQTKGKIKYIDVINGKKNFYDNKWQPYGKKHEVIIKPKRNPIIGIRNYILIRSPVITNSPIGFDLLFGDCVFPYGKGKVSDFLFMITHEGDYHNFKKTIVLSFENELDGVYLKNEDSFSSFVSEYSANANSNYLKKLDLNCQTTKYQKG